MSSGRVSSVTRPLARYRESTTADDAFQCFARLGLSWRLECQGFGGSRLWAARACREDSLGERLLKHAPPNRARLLYNKYAAFYGTLVVDE